MSDEKTPLLSSTGQRLSTTAPQLPAAGDVTEPHDVPLPVSDESPPTVESAPPLRQWIRQVSVLTYVLVIVFASSSMLGSIGPMVEMPLLVETQPEGWSLQSYTTLAHQVGKLGPLLYVVMSCVSPRMLRDAYVIYGITLLGMGCYILMALFWQETSIVAGGEHSTAFVALTASMAAADSTSIVVYPAYIASFRPQYMSAVFVGQAFCGLLPGILGFVQGVPAQPPCSINGNSSEEEEELEGVTEEHVSLGSSQPRISVTLFWILMAGIYVLSAVAFTVLNFSPFCRRELANTAPIGVPRVQADDEEKHARAGREQDVVRTKGASVQMGLLFLIYSGTSVLMSVVLPPLTPYSTMPYGSQVYEVAAQGRMVLVPLACLASLFTPGVTVKGLSVITLVGLALTSYVTCLAAMSPHPPLQDQVLGDVLTTASFLILYPLMFYAMAGSALLLRKAGGRQALIRGGCFNQIGDLLGATLMFLLVNVLVVFGSQPSGCT